MKKFLFLWVALIATLNMSAAVTYELNGGVTNDYGWQSKGDMFAAFMTDAGATDFETLDYYMQQEDPFGPNICTKLTDASPAIAMTEKWGWLETYIMQAHTDQAADGASTLTAGGSGTAWRYAVGAFFISRQRTSWPRSADFTELGKDSVYIPTWQHAYANPTEPTEAFTLNAPYKKDAVFGGWYTTADFSGTAITTIDATTTGTLYARWYEHMATAEINKATDGTLVAVTGVVNYVRRNNVYIQDETGGTLVYTAETATCSVGQKITAIGQKATYAGAPEVKEAQIIATETGTLSAPKYITLADLVADKDWKFFGQRVRVLNVVIDSYDKYSNPTVTDGTNKALCHYMVLDSTQFPVGTAVTLTGIAAYHNQFQFTGNANDIAILGQYNNKDYFLMGDFNAWNKDASPVFTQISATDYKLTVPAIYGECKVIKTQDDWWPQWGATTQGDSVLPGTGYAMKYAFASYIDAANLYIGKKEMGYTDATFILSQNGDDMTFNFVSGKEYKLEDMPHTYYLVGKFCNWELQSSIKFEEENGVLTAYVPTLSDEFKVVQDQTWLVQWGTNWDTKEAVKMGEPYIMGAKTDAQGEASDCTLGGVIYQNAKLTLVKNESGDMVLTLVSGEKQTFSYTLNETDKTATITSLLDKTLTEWEIPETIEGSDGTIYKVTEIAEDAMYQCTNLTSVTIPRYVTKIGYGALAGCTSLTKITWDAIACSGIRDSNYGYSIYSHVELFPYQTTGDVRPQITSFIIGDEVEYLPNGICKYMTNLTSITIPASVKYIGEEFYNTGITSVIWNANVGDRCKSPYKESDNQSSYEDYLQHTYLPFQNIASQITSFTIGENVDSIPQGLCFAMVNLPSVNIPKDVKYIGDGAFNGCEKVSDITLGDKVTYIGASAFSGTNISSVTIPEGVTYMGNSVFANAMNLKSVVWNVRALQGDGYYREYYYDNDDDDNWTLIFYHAPVTSFTFGENVDSIPSRLCYGMNQLTSIIVPDNVALIGTQAFANTGITSITFPERLQKLGNQVCNNTPLNTIVWNVRNLENGGYYSGEDGLFGNVSAQITSFTMGDKVEVIPNGLCKGMSRLTTIPLSANIRSIGNEAFAGTGITSITIPENMKNVGYRICDGTPLSSVVWNAVSAHGSEPFLGVTEQITSFVLGDKVTYIPDYLCSSMNKLTSIAIPATVDSIGARAFEGCSGLTSMVIPGNLKYIGNLSFAYCTSLNKIEIKNVIEECDAYCFMGCTALDTLITSANMLEISLTRNDNNSYLPKNIRYIKITGGELSDNAFEVINRNYKALRTLDLAATANTSLADEAFKGCYNLETLALPGAMEEIPYMMAAECVSLKSITIPAATKTIGHRAFENCRLLRDVQFTANGQLTAIGNWAFYNCHELRSIAIPEGVTAVGYAAFYGCTYLADISLPSTVESIADNGFALCAKLGKMTVNAAVPPVVEAKTFENVSRSIPVYVPLQAVPLYQAADIWKDFNIQGVATGVTSVVDTQDVNCTKIVRNGQVLILRNGHTYSLTGVMVE